MPGGQVAVLEAAEFEAEAFDGIVGFGVVAEGFGDGLMVKGPKFEPPPVGAGCAARCSHPPNSASRSLNLGPEIRHQITRRTALGKLKELNPCLCHCV